MDADYPEHLLEREPAGPRVDPGLWPGTFDDLTTRI